ncbi:Adhesion G protein-coupled receptor E2, partial [Dissostichus eleginoides]
VVSLSWISSSGGVSELDILLRWCLLIVRFTKPPWSQRFRTLRTTTDSQTLRANTDPQDNHRPSGQPQTGYKPEL